MFTKDICDESVSDELRYKLRCYSKAIINNNITRSTYYEYSNANI